MTMFKVAEVTSLAARGAVLYLSDKNDGVIGQLVYSLAFRAFTIGIEKDQVDASICLPRDTRFTASRGEAKTRLDRIGGTDLGKFALALRDNRRSREQSGSFSGGNLY